MSNGLVFDPLARRIDSSVLALTPSSSYSFPTELEIYVYFDSSEYDLDPTWTVNKSPLDLDDIGHPKIDLDRPSG